MEIKIEIDLELAEKLENYCKIRKMNKSQIIVESLIEKLDNWQNLENSKQTMEEKLAKNQQLASQQILRNLKFSGKNLLN